MYYREDKNGQILEEGINEAGAHVLVDRGGDVVLRRTACTMLPFYIFYSMFGFQRVGDLDLGRRRLQARGFLLGATAGPHDARRRRPAAPGRPQASDGATIPNCVATTRPLRTSSR